jgi:hypothetical protein
MVRLLVLAVIVILVVIAFRLGRQSEQGRLIDLEPDKAESEKWSAKTAEETPRDATGRASGSSTTGAGTSRAATGSVSSVRANQRDDDVIDVDPADIEEL